MLHFGRKTAAFLGLSRSRTRIWQLRRFGDVVHGGDGERTSNDHGRFNLEGFHAGNYSDAVRNEEVSRRGRFLEAGLEGDGGILLSDDERHDLDGSNGCSFVEDEEEGVGRDRECCSHRWKFMEGVRLEAERVYEIVQQDGLGFDFRLELDAMKVMVSSFLVREVLIRILRSINGANKDRSARLAFKFFTWAGQQEGYKHTANHYNIALKIFAECRELKGMWKLIDVMVQDGLSVTARTFNILLSACGAAGLRRKLVASFLKTKSFNYRPFKHSYNAILHALVSIDQFRLIEWVYQQMKLDGHEPDVLTYNILMRAKYMLRKLDEFHRLLGEMGEVGITPDLHTYNLLLHVLGKGDKPLAAHNLLNYMEEVGCQPRVIHYTSLIDGLSRAGNLEASRYFFEEMQKKGCEPDVVCYTVMVTSYVIAGEFEMAERMFGEMVMKGHLPNVYTYNSMIRGLCDADKFGEACSMLKDMEIRGCTPNFLVYSRIVGRLRNARKFTEARNVITDMLEKGRYVHLLSRFRGYKRL